MPLGTPIPTPPVGSPTNPKGPGGVVTKMPTPTVGSPTNPSWSATPQPRYSPGVSNPNAGTQYQPTNQPNTRWAATPPVASDPYSDLIHSQMDLINGQMRIDNQSLQDNYNNTTAKLYPLDMADLQARYAQDRAGLQGQQNRNGIAQAQNDSDAAFAGIDFANTTNYRNQARAFNEQDRAHGIRNAGDLSAQALRQFGLGTDKNNFAFGQQFRNDASQATSKGSVMSAGYQQDRKDNRMNRDLSQRDTQLGFDTSNTSIANNLYNANLGLDRNNSSLTNQQNGAQVANDRAQANAKFQNDTLKSFANEYGVTAQQMNGALERGAQRLGINRDALVGKLAQAQQSNDAASKASIAQLMTQLLQHAQQ